MAASAIPDAFQQTIHMNWELQLTVGVLSSLGNLCCILWMLCGSQKIDSYHLFQEHKKIGGVQYSQIEPNASAANFPKEKQKSFLNIK